MFNINRLFTIAALLVSVANVFAAPSNDLSSFYQMSVEDEDVAMPSDHNLKVEEIEAQQQIVDEVDDILEWIEAKANAYNQLRSAFGSDQSWPLEAAAGQKVANQRSFERMRRAPGSEFLGKRSSPAFAHARSGNSAHPGIQLRRIQLNKRRPGSEFLGRRK